MEYIAYRNKMLWVSISYISKKIDVTERSVRLRRQKEYDGKNIEGFCPFYIYKENLTLSSESLKEAEIEFVTQELRIFFDVNSAPHKIFEILSNVEKLPKGFIYQCIQLFFSSFGKKYTDRHIINLVSEKKGSIFETKKTGRKKVFDRFHESIVRYLYVDSVKSGNGIKRTLEESHRIYCDILKYYVKLWSDKGLLMWLEGKCKAKEHIINEETGEVYYEKGSFVNDEPVTYRRIHQVFNTLYMKIAIEEIRNGERKQTNPYVIQERLNAIHAIHYADGWTLPFYLNNGFGRAILYVVMEGCTKRIIGWHLLNTAENDEGRLIALRNALENTQYIPALAICDGANSYGKFSEILGTKVDFRVPQSKSENKAEQFFSVFSEILKKYRGHTGSNMVGTTANNRRHKDLNPKNKEYPRIEFSQLKQVVYQAIEKYNASKPELEEYPVYLMSKKVELHTLAKIYGKEVKRINWRGGYLNTGGFNYVVPEELILKNENKTFSGFEYGGKFYVFGEKQKFLGVCEHAVMANPLGANPKEAFEAYQIVDEIAKKKSNDRFDLEESVVSEIMEGEEFPQDYLAMTEIARYKNKKQEAFDADKKHQEQQEEKSPRRIRRKA